MQLRLDDILPRPYPQTDPTYSGMHAGENLRIVVASSKKAKQRPYISFRRQRRTQGDQYDRPLIRVLFWKRIIRTWWWRFFHVCLFHMQMPCIFWADPIFFSINTDTSARIHAHTLIPMNTRTHTLPLWAPSRDWAGISSWNLRSHRRHLIVDGNVYSHWMHIARNHEINPEINASTRIWTLVGWEYHSPSNHPTIGWFSIELKQYMNS